MDRMSISSLGYRIEVFIDHGDVDYCIKKIKTTRREAIIDLAESAIEELVNESCDQDLRQTETTED